MTANKKDIRAPAGKKDGNKLAAGPSCCNNSTANLKNNGLRIVNITAVGDLHQRFDLSDLYCKLLNFPVQYEPEIYPAVLLKLHNNNHCTIFSSGKFIITGCSSQDELEEVYRKLFEIIKKVET